MAAEQCKLNSSAWFHHIYVLKSTLAKGHVPLSGVLLCCTSIGVDQRVSQSVLWSLAFSSC
jgi:hypothetical protein